jgi:hypothetical protein
MGSIFKLKPAIARVNTNHPLARGLGLFLLMNQSGTVLRNLAPPIGAAASHVHDVLIGDPVVQRIVKDPSLGPSNALECRNSVGNFTKGTFRSGTTMPDTNGVFTADFQILPRNVTNGYGTILAEDSGDGIYLRSNGFLKPTVYFSGDHNATTDIGNLGIQWHHYAIVNDTANSRGEFYLDGVADGTYSPAGLTSWTPGSLFNDAAGDRLQAWLNYFRLWYRALSAQECKQLAADPYCLVDPGRKWWMLPSNSIRQGPIEEVGEGVVRITYELANTLAADPHETSEADDRILYDLIGTYTPTIRETGGGSDTIDYTLTEAISYTVRETAEVTDDNESDRNRVSGQTQIPSGPAMAIITHIYDYFGPGIDWAFSDVRRTAPAHDHVGKVLTWGTSTREIPIPPGGPPRLGRMVIEFDDTPDPVTGIQFFRSQFGPKTPKGKRVDLKIGPADGKESLFQIPAAGVISHATFPPGKMRLELPDVRYKMQKPMPGLINDTNFPNLPPGVKDAFMPFVLGEVSSVGFGGQGAIKLIHVDTVQNRYAVARHTVEAVTVYTKAIDATEFTEVSTGWSLVEEPMTFFGLEHLMNFVQFDSALPDGTEVRADVTGYPSSGGWGTVPLVLEGVSENVVDHVVNVVYYFDALEKGRIRTYEEAFATWDMVSMSAVRDQFTEAGYASAYAITEPFTQEVILTQLLSTFMIHWFPSRLDKTKFVMTGETPEDAPIFGDFHSILLESEMPELSRDTRNRIIYNFAPIKDLSGLQFAGHGTYDNTGDQAQLTDSDGEPIIEPEEIDLHACRDADVAALLATEWGNWRDQDAHRVTFELDMPTKLSQVDLARAFKITHYGGLKEGGWFRETFIPYKITDDFDRLKFVIEAIRRVSVPAILPQTQPRGEWRINSRVGPWYYTGNKTLFMCFCDDAADYKKIVMIASING